MSEAPPEQKVHVGGSRVRCPYCHDDVLAEASDWVACAGCLARHHRSCWDEGGSCSACGAADPLVRATPRGTRARSASRLEVLPGRDGQEGEASPVMGGPRRLTTRRVFAGEATIDDAAWLNSTVRRATKTKGRVTVEGRSLVWRPDPTQQGCPKVAGLKVALSTVGEGTELKLEEELTGAFVGRVALFVVVIGVLALGGAIAIVESIGLSALLPLLIPLWFVGQFFLAREAFARHAQQRRRAHTQLLERLTQGLTWAPPERERPPQAGLEKAPAKAPPKAATKAPSEGELGEDEPSEGDPREGEPREDEPSEAVVE
jgi:hypothetical protein